MQRGTLPPLWTPSAERNRASNFQHYLSWLEQHRGLRFDGYHDTWAWSATQIEDFWASLWAYFDIRATQHYTSVLESRVMPGARWFTGARLNYAEHAFLRAGPAPALLHLSELRALEAVSWGELRARVASVAATLRELGIRRGDRVAALLPNIPEAVIAFLACASVGAVWSSCSPEFGVESVTERFGQIEPRLLLTVDGYAYAGRRIDRRADVIRLRRGLPSVQHVVLVPNLDESAALPDSLRWTELLQRDVALEFASVPFEHPLWILFSSGSTGRPRQSCTVTAVFCSSI